MIISVNALVSLVKKILDWGKQKCCACNYMALLSVTMPFINEGT